jgi:hypothetical protein
MLNALAGVARKLRDPKPLDACGRRSASAYRAAVD